MKLYGSIIVTYRCNARCNMCDVWRNPSKSAEEIRPEIIDRLPQMDFANVTGGEPFVRGDLDQIIGRLSKKAKRIVISTNGFFTDRIINLCRQFPKLGIRISIEGLEKSNDLIRGIPDGFNRTQNTLKQLQMMGLKDIGFAMTVQDLNYHDLVPLYRMAKGLDYEFATATVHNSHYFQKWDNRISQQEKVISAFRGLIKELLVSKKIKEWFRAYFNFGLINYIRGNPRFLPCEMGKSAFFLDPLGNVLACNGMDKAIPMGNLNHQSWEKLWGSRQSGEVRECVKNCKKNCWMIGSASPAIMRHPIKPVLWVLKKKIGL